MVVLLLKYLTPSHFEIEGSGLKVSVHFHYYWSGGRATVGVTQGVKEGIVLAAK